MSADTKPEGRHGGLLRLLASAKAWAAIAAAVGAVLAALNVPADRVTAIVTAITSLGAIVVLAIAYEDGARNAAAGPPEPPK